MTKTGTLDKRLGLFRSLNGLAVNEDTFASDNTSSHRGPDRDSAECC